MGRPGGAGGRDADGLDGELAHVDNEHLERGPFRKPVRVPAQPGTRGSQGGPGGNGGHSGNVFVQSVDFTDEPRVDVSVGSGGLGGAGARRGRNGGGGYAYAGPNGSRGAKGAKGTYTKTRLTGDGYRVTATSLLGPKAASWA